MNEMQAFVNMKKIMSLCVIQAHSGKYIYIGHVPCEIGYINATPEQIENAKFGERFGPKKRSFNTEEEAILFAKSKGYKVEK